MKVAGLANRTRWLSLLAVGCLLSCTGSETPAGPATGGSGPSAGGTQAMGGASPATGGVLGSGGSPAATGGTATGGKATGGTSTGGTATGGTTGSAGGTMRDISSLELVKEMKLGWNLGNTLDGYPLETSWGNPLTTQAMIDTVKAGGFNTVRIPVTWQDHMGGAPNYTIVTSWLDRVEVIANYVLRNGMYAIVNTHHDGWVSVMPTANEATITDTIVKLWTQIANRFKNYDDHLLLETFNEPRTTDSTEWTGGTAAARAMLNRYNAAAVNAIRATGGNNALRHIMIPTHAANPSTTTINALVIPNDDPRIIVSLHTYYPNLFSMGGGATTWGTNADRTAMATELDRIADSLPRRGRAVVIGEWGSINQNNTAARVAHAGTYAEYVTARGICPIWWDNGGTGTDGFGLLNRRANPPAWAFPDIVNALATGATTGAAAAP
jgi:endoglucanase